MELQQSNQILTEAGTIAVSALGRDLEEHIPAGSAAPIAFISSSNFALLSALAFLSRSGRSGLIANADSVQESLPQRLRDEGYQLAYLEASGNAVQVTSFEPQASEAVLGEAQVSLLTSGTTGTPKLVHHRWESLFTYARVSEWREENWLLTYLPGTYAWTQLALLSLFCPGQSLSAPENREIEEMWAFAVKKKVSAISSTPTFWRALLLRIGSESLRTLALRQLTLGGEVVDQELLDLLRLCFPSARVSHIYASTEAGVGFVVHDGKEGFPAAWLNVVREGSPQLKVENERLFIRSPFAAEGTQWHDSGDLVEHRGDRIVVVGRADRDILNIGGSKIPASSIERLLLQVEGVLWCRASIKEAPFGGRLVKVDLVVSEELAAIPPAERETRLCQELAAQLPEWAVPRLWKFVDTIPMHASLKGV